MQKSKPYTKSSTSNGRNEVAYWLEQRNKHWQQAISLMDKISAQPHSTSQDLKILLGNFQSIARDLSLARSLMPGSHLSQYLEALFLRAHEIVYAEPHAWREEIKALYIKEIPQTAKSLLAPIIWVISIFIAAVIVGWVMVDMNPLLASIFLPGEMIDTVQQGKLWLESIFGIVPSSIIAFNITLNNIIVALTAFCLGALYGIGTLYIIVLNGLMLGATFAYTAEYNLALPLFEFVIAHGVVELSIICLAGAAGVNLGEALVRPKGCTRGEAFAKAVKQGGQLLAIAIPFLVLAGITESYISPLKELPLLFKALWGLSFGVVFWGLLLYNPFKS